jgi:hypothetical protein
MREKGKISSSLSRVSPRLCTSGTNLEFARVFVLLVQIGIGFQFEGQIALGVKISVSFDVVHHSLQHVRPGCVPTGSLESDVGKMNVQMVMYFHYQPSYYHLHVHFTHVAFEAPGRDTSGAHVLQTVMDNIERDGDFYAKCNLPFKLKANSDLYQKYKDAGKL